MNGQAVLQLVENPIGSDPEVVCQTASEMFAKVQLVSLKVVLTKVLFSPAQPRQLQQLLPQHHIPHLKQDIGADGVTGVSVVSLAATDSNQNLEIVTEAFAKVTQRKRNLARLMLLFAQQQQLLLLQRRLLLLHGANGPTGVTAM